MHRPYSLLASASMALIAASPLRAQARNLLDEDIRLSTSLLKDASPLAGRGPVLGLRTIF